MTRRWGKTFPAPIEGRPDTYYLTLWQSKKNPWEWVTIYLTHRNDWQGRFALLRENLSRGFQARLFGWHLTLDIRKYREGRAYYKPHPRGKS